MKLRVTLGLSCLLMLASCGGDGASAGDGADGDTTTGGEDLSGGAVVAEVAWGEMNRAQRLAFMQQTVLPEMRAMFQEHDPERFADFGCPTCHGPTMQDVDFAMPNGIAPLDPTQIGAMFQSEQPMAQFMTQRVWPRMAELLQEPPYDPETHEGFACMNCHGTAEGG